MLRIHNFISSSQLHRNLASYLQKIDQDQNSIIVYRHKKIVAILKPLTQEQKQLLKVIHRNLRKIEAHKQLRKRF